MRFQYCPQCGQQLSLREAGDDGLTPYCETCGEMWFDMFPSCVIILVANEFHEIALLHEPRLSDRGIFVSGYITPGESAEEAAKREVREELGLEILELESTGTYWFPMRGQLMHGFIGRTAKKDLVCSPEIESAAWVNAYRAPEVMFLNRKDNRAYDIYKRYMSEIGLGSDG